MSGTQESTTDATLDLAPLFEAFEQAAGRRLEHQAPAPVMLPPPDDGLLTMEIGSTPPWCLRMRIADIVVLGGCLRFLDDDEVRDRLTSGPSPADAEVVFDLLSKSLDHLGAVQRLDEQPPVGETFRVSFQVAGFESSDAFVAARVDADASGDTAASDTAASDTAASEAAPSEAASGPEQDDSPATSPAGPASAEAAAMPDAVADEAPESAEPVALAGRLTLLHVDTDGERAKSVREAAAANGLRLLDQKSPRSVLDWALLERVVDVIVLDDTWPRAQRLRDNLAADTRTADLPILPPDPDVESLLAAVKRAAHGKRQGD